MAGKNWDGMVIDDPWDRKWDSPEHRAKVQRHFNRMVSIMAEENVMNSIGIYEVFAVYAENPESPVVFRPKEAFSFGADEDEAVLRSGIYLVLAAAKKEPSTATLDPRYITIITRKLGDAKTPSQS